MKSKSLLILIAVLAMGIFAYYFKANSNSNAVDANSSLIPGLEENLKTVTKFVVTKAGNVPVSEVSKSDKGWVVDNRDGYTANIAAVRGLFENLSEAKLVEAKTSNPDNYAKLGVEDIDSKQSQGVQFTLEGLQDDVNIIFGKDGSSGKNTQFVRRVGEPQSWLVNKKLNIKRSVTDWLKKDLIDIPPERIKSMQIIHSDGEVINIANDGEEAYKFTLDATPPEGMKVSESEVYQLANALSYLQLRDVAAFSNINADSIEPVTTVFKTFDGLTVTSKSYATEFDTHFTIDVAFSADDIDKEVDSSESQTESTSDAAMKSDPKAAEELANTAKTKLAGWAYVFPSITQSALTKKLADFFVPLEEDK